jgi:hypothetical protein
VPVSNWLERQKLFLVVEIVRLSGPAQLRFRDPLRQGACPFGIYAIMTPAQSGCHGITRTYGHESVIGKIDLRHTGCDISQAKHSQ